jgi:hypothetical protein
MNDHVDERNDLGAPRWLELASGGGVLLRTLAETLTNRPPRRALRERAGPTLTADAPWPLSPPR